MATIERFEDLEVWMKARVFAKKVHLLTHSGVFGRDYKLRDQLAGSTGSVMDNIAEGFERGGKREFIQFLVISRGSAGEVRSQLYRALDFAYIDQEDFKELKTGIEEISRMLTGLIRYLNGSNIKGTKFLEPRAKYKRNRPPL